MDKNLIAIKAKGLTKIYKLYDTPLDRLKESLNPFKRKYHKDFYSLRDVSFEIERGKAIGIIGKNGSGKSTLLKIITGVLTPTSGNVIVDGKISALLELGTGFNPDLTGIENIYLTGTITGFSRKEIEEKIDNILSFADIGEYAFQPIKTYSSGMFVRLAFAVSINVEPDILIIDEALSVGDIRFQQKCFRRIKSFRESGKTILFVSHDMSSVKSFCDSVIWLKDGIVFKVGNPADLTREYISFMSYGLESFEGSIDDAPAPAEKERGDKPDIEWEGLSNCSSFGEGGAEIQKVALYLKEPFKKLKVCNEGCWVILLLKLKATSDIASPIIGFNMYNEFGHCILGVNNIIIGFIIEPIKNGSAFLVKFEFKLPTLKNGNYTFAIAIANGNIENHVQLQWVHDAYILQVSSDNIQSKLGHYFALSEQETRMEINPFVCGNT